MLVLVLFLALLTTTFLLQSFSTFLLLLLLLLLLPRFYNYNVVDVNYSDDYCSLLFLLIVTSKPHVREEQTHGISDLLWTLAGPA